MANNESENLRQSVNKLIDSLLGTKWMRSDSTKTTVNQSEQQSTAQSPGTTTPEQYMPSNQLPNLLGTGIQVNRAFDYHKPENFNCCYKIRFI